MSENAVVEKKPKPKSVLDRLKKLKHKEIILAVVAVAVMLLIYFSTLTSCSGSGAAAEEKTSDYCTDMRTRIVTAVNAMSGGGKCEVIVSWESGVEAVIAYVTNEGQNNSSQSPQIVQGGPIILKEVYPKALGVVVVCDNGDNVRLQVQIKDMISTLLEINPAKIAVFKGNG